MRQGSPKPATSEKDVHTTSLRKALGQCAFGLETATPCIRVKLAPVSSSRSGCELASSPSRPGPDRVSTPEHPGQVGNGFVMVAGRPIPTMALTVVPRNIHAPGISPRLGMASLSSRGREPSYLGCFGRPLHAVLFAHSPSQNRRAKSKTPKALCWGMALAWAGSARRLRSSTDVLHPRMPQQNTLGVASTLSSLCQMMPHPTRRFCAKSPATATPRIAAPITGPPG